MLQDIFRRGIPSHLLTRVKSGELRVYGSAIRVVANGQIAGFLQETGGLGRLAEQVISKTPVGAAVNLVGHAVTIGQNEQIKAALATMQTLQIANLALGAAGIGISIAGFAVLSHKIGRVEQQVSAMGEQLDRIAKTVDALRQEPIRQDFTRLKTVAEQLNEGWDLPNPESQWDAVARDAHALVDSFDRRASELLDAGDIDPVALDPFAEALALAIATRVSARLARGEDVAARRAAVDGTKRLTGLGSRLRLGELALARIGAEVATGTPAWAEALKRGTDELRPVLAVFREREIAVDSTAAMLAELEQRDIGGRAWLEAARAETDAPLLCLPTQA